MKLHPESQRREATGCNRAGDAMDGKSSNKEIASDASLQKVQIFNLGHKFLAPQPNFFPDTTLDSETP